MVDTNEIMTRVRELADESGMTLAEIARQCGESEQKIKRVLDGKNPSFAPMCAIITACGGSVDEIIKAPPPKTHVVNEPLVRELKERIASLNKWAKAGWILFAVFAFVVLVILIVDLANPNIGWFRGAAMQAYYNANNTSATVQALKRVLQGVQQFIL